MKTFLLDFNNFIYFFFWFFLQDNFWLVFLLDGLYSESRNLIQIPIQIFESVSNFPGKNLRLEDTKAVGGWMNGWKTRYWVGKIVIYKCYRIHVNTYNMYSKDFPEIFCKWFVSSNNNWFYPKYRFFFLFSFGLWSLNDLLLHK